MHEILDSDFEAAMVLLVTLYSKFHNANLTNFDLQVFPFCKQSTTFKSKQKALETTTGKDLSSQNVDGMHETASISQKSAIFKELTFLSTLSTT